MDKGGDERDLGGAVAGFEVPAMEAFLEVKGKRDSACRESETWMFRLLSLAWLLRAEMVFILIHHFGSKWWINTVEHNVRAHCSKPLGGLQFVHVDHYTCIGPLSNGKGFPNCIANSPRVEPLTLECS